MSWKARAQAKEKGKGQGVVAPSAEKRGHSDRRWQARGAQSEFPVSPPDSRRKSPDVLAANKQGGASSVRVNPTQVASDASLKVAPIERCMAFLGPEDTAELRILQAALDKARAQTVLPHPAKQAEVCQAYCTRAARRLEKARAAVVAAQEAVARFEAELQEGLQRLEDLKAATVPTCRPPVDPASTVSGDQAEEVCLLRAAVMELTRERDSLRSRVPPTAPLDDPSNTLAVVPVQPGGSRVMGTLIDEADSDLRRMQGRFTPY